MAGPATVWFSAQHIYQKNHRKMAGAYQVFCSVYMSLQSDSPPSASFDHTTALGEKKISGWAFKALSSSWELCFFSLLLHLTDLGEAKGRGGMPYVQRDPSITLLAEAATLWRLPIPDTPPCAGRGVKYIQTSESCRRYLPFLRALTCSFCFSSWCQGRRQPQDGVFCLFPLRAAVVGLPFVMGAI